jgi:hypothetical protein
MDQNIADLRKSYERDALDESASLADPIAQFEHWLKQALDAKLPEPTAMTLATVGADGRASTRVVLLKGCDARGLVWYTNYHSRNHQPDGDRQIHPDGDAQMRIGDQGRAASAQRRGHEQGGNRDRNQDCREIFRQKHRIVSETNRTGHSSGSINNMGGNGSHESKADNVPVSSYSPARNARPLLCATGFSVCHWLCQCVF